MNMIVLALDSSADTVSAAVLRDDEPLAERSWRTPLPADALLCGRVAEEVAGLAAACGLACAPAFASLSRASFVGALARVRLQDPAFDVRASLQPLYLRRPGITRPSHPLTGVLDRSQ
ncbi:MAG TPA: hypothetical protein VKF37_03615 [Chloroflexota bacterium]|nr:hypothetical protein [Chloroflexota bacterium]